MTTRRVTVGAVRTERRFVVEFTSPTEEERIPITPSIDTSRIPAGTPFTSTHPTLSEGVLRRDIVVVAALLDHGYTDERGREIPDTITYTGTGGYWKRVPASAVEFLD